MIIGLSGYARSGKDTAAEGLTAIGFKRVGFADKLRDFLYALNPVVEVEEIICPPPKTIEARCDCDHKLLQGHEVFRVRDVIDEHGWDGYKSTSYGPELRALLQRLGTECGRELISDTIWIDAALNGQEGDIVVADVRFPNEAQAIKDRGGLVFRITRTGVEAVNAHPSETALDDWPWDYEIHNNGTVDDLHLKMRETLAIHNVKEIAKAAKFGYKFTGGNA